MVTKRNFCAGGNGSDVPIRESKRQFTKFRTFFGDALKGLTQQEFIEELKPFFQKVVREEVERAILRVSHSCPRYAPNHGEPSGTRVWELHFDCKFPSTLFTNSKVESEDGESIKIVLLDASSKQIVSSGPLSSIRVEVVALDGDFGGDDQEDWTEDDFNSRVVIQREGKRPLLTGERKITLRDGVGNIGDVSFTDNSSWIRSRRFRLGVKVLQTTPEQRIREAISEAFVVKDHRGESYKKHHPPYSGDEVWRLEKIAKEGAFHKRLTFNGICTVKDFLRLYNTDPFALRTVLGGKITNKTWEVITEHAADCILDDENLYMYYRATERAGLVFNSTYKVVGITFDGHNFQLLDKNSNFQMQLVERLKRHAYKNLHELVLIDEQSAVGFSMTRLGLQADSPSVSNLDLQQGNYIEHQDESGMQLSFNQITTSPPNIFEVEDSTQFEVSTSQNFYPTLRNSFSMKNLFSGFYEGNCWPTSGNNSAPDDTTYPSETSTLIPTTSTWGQGNGFLLNPNTEGQVGIFSSFPDFGIHIPRNRKSKAQWCKLRAAVKWAISVRRNAAAKRMARPIYLDF